MKSPSAFGGFTLTELLAVITIIVLLMALLFPVVSRVIASAKQTQCSSNLRQLGLGINAYAMDNNDEIPYLVNATKSKSWASEISPYVNVPIGRIGERPPNPYQCPSCDYTVVGGNASNFGKNYYLNSYTDDSNSLRTGIRFSTIPAPSKYYLLADSTIGTGGQANRTIGNASSPPSNEFTKYWIESRHNHRANILFCDFHVEALSIDEIGDPVYGEPPWTPRRP